MDTLATIAALPPGRQELTLTTDDGQTLGASLYEPAGPARGAILINGATATPQRYYARFAAFLASSGLRVLTFDYRGVGRSRPRSLRGFQATISDWGRRDAPAALRLLRGLEPELPIVLIGHSFGGQTLGLSEALHEVEAAVLVAAQFGHYRLWPQPSRTWLALLWHVVMPAVSTLAGYYPGRLGMGEDLPRGVAEEWARWCRHPDYLLGYIPGARERFARFDRPILSFSFSDDTFAPRAAVEALLSGLGSPSIDSRHLRPEALGVRSLGHFGFFRPHFEATFWRQTLGFIEQVLSGASSQARAPCPEKPGSGSLQDVAARGG